jgi:hypothetical protein
MARFKNPGTFLILMLAVLSVSINAEVPDLINYQGRLTDDEGQPFHGPKLIKFNIYSSDTGDDLLWSSGFQTIQINNGLFEYELGSNVALPEDLFTGDSPRYLGITIDVGPELQPRTQFITAAYAYHALKADTSNWTLDGPGGGGWVDDGTVVRLESASDSIGIGTSAPEATLHVNGGIIIGSDTKVGSLDIRRAGIANPVMSLTSNADGASQLWYDEAGTTVAGLYADPSGGGDGGYFYVKRSGAYSAFRVDGNYDNTGSPRVSIFGASRSATFDMTQSGNSSVSLPTDAVSSIEIHNEPGTASYTEGGGSGTAIGASVTVIGSRSITVPSSGYVLVLASGQVTMNHVNGTDSYCQFGVSDNNAAFPPNQDITVGLDDNAPSGYYHMGSTFHGLFGVAGAGTYTYYFLGDETSGTFTLYDAQLTLLYIPTNYGTVMPTKQGIAQEETRGEGWPGMTAATVAAERSESEAANMARIERELSDMRAEFEALREEMKERR